MEGFSSIFLVFFYQISLGGLFALSAAPFHDLERGFYKSTAGVLFVIAVLGLWGKSYLYWQGLSARITWLAGAEMFFHVSFAASFACYMVSLWGERQKFRARSFSFCVLAGLAGLLLTARSFYAGPAVSFESLVYPVNFLFSALLLGSVTVGMLIGHWYLIDTGQSLDPFVRIYKFFVITLVGQCVFAIFAIFGLYYLGSTESAAALRRLWLNHSSLVVTRVLVGQIAPIILSWMIWRTLLIPHTMAATGLFYIALLAVFVGEILARQILALTGLPL